MASYQKRGKTWQYTISRMVNGKSDPIRKGGFRTKPEAVAAATLIEADLLKGLSPALKDVPFDDYFEEWVKVYKVDIKEVTLERYDDTLRCIKEHFKGKAIQDITKRSYQAFINKYGESWAKETTRKMNTHIRSCVKDAVDEGIIRVDFTRDVVIVGNNAAKRPEDKHLNYEDSQKLLNELNKRLDRALGYYVLYLGLTTGMRFAEIVGLTRKDFLFVTNEIVVNKTWDYKTGKGFDITKNDPSNRIIKADKKTMDVFKKLFATTPANIHGLVFFSPQSKYKVLSNDGTNKLLRTTLKELGIEHITMHGLRHTHASILLYRKASIYYVSERLGHSGIDTTLKYYAHVIKELREEDTKIATDTFESMVLG